MPRDSVTSKPSTLEPDKTSKATHSSKMNMVSEYRLQTFGGVLLVLLGLLFWVWGGTAMKFNGMVTPEGDSLASFVRQIGILALLLPLAWTICTIKKERNQTSRWTRRHTLISGFPVAFAMFYLLGKSLTYGRIYIW
jgi:hypothetical protein